MEEKPIKLKLKIQGGRGSVIPPGVTEILTIEVIDYAATFHFLDSKITYLFAGRQLQDGVESYYSERLKKAICKYPNMNRQDIIKHIQERLNTLRSKNVR